MAKVRVVTIHEYSLPVDGYIHPATNDLVLDPAEMMEIDQEAAEDVTEFFDELPLISRTWTLIDED